jgi:hypothetical protein
VFSIDQLEFTDEWGYAEWHIGGDNELRLRTQLRVVFEGTDDPDLRAGNLLNDDNKPTSLHDLEYRMAGPGRHSRGPSALCVVNLGAVG